MPTDLHEHPDYQQFLARIREMPDDDLRRLVFADWLDERGQMDRAEWMRFSINSPAVMTCMGDASVGLCCPYDGGWCPNCSAAIRWGLPERLAGEDGYEYRRGFVHTVRATLAVLVGRECRVCERIGSFGGWTGDGQQTPVDYEEYDCRFCNGTGGTRGLLPELLRREPVARVEVVDANTSPAFRYGGWTVHPSTFAPDELSAALLSLCQSTDRAGAVTG